MSQPHPILKAAALGTSILLVWGFVAYQANAFNWRLEHGPLNGATDNAIEHDQTIMFGTKSPTKLLDPPAPAPTDTNPNIMSSSKGGPVFTPPAPTRSESDPTIMSSSKSTILAPPPAQAAANGPGRNRSQSAARSR